jgi:hypothetical protein
MLIGRSHDHAAGISEEGSSEPQITAPRVFILSDFRTLCDALALALAQASVTVVGASDTPITATTIAALAPDVLLLDIATLAALSNAIALHQLLPDLRIIAISVAEVEDEIVACAKAGVAGFVSRREPTQLHATFPNARVIHCRRDPIDTCLSIYFTNFNYVEFSVDRDWIVHYYQQYARLMEHWRAVLPSTCLLEIKYEELIAAPEPVTRRIIDFCGLQWNDACLRPEQNQRVVKTASWWQARQPIYGTSVSRWRRYEPWLGAFNRLVPAT